MKTKWLPFLMLLFLLIDACKPDCKRNIVLKQDYKQYQEWYPYHGLDTIYFLRVPEMDTIKFLGSEISYPTYIRYGACECCEDEKIEYIKQEFTNLDNKYTIQIEMHEYILDFTLFKEYEYSFFIKGNSQKYSEVVTPDSTYNMATRENKWIQSCYFAPKIGIVKYSFDSTHHWFFLRNI
ncbi:MAG: hypothetical protein ACOVP1_10070 [Bacteroidia bacterium]